MSDMILLNVTKAGICFFTTMIPVIAIIPTDILTIYDRWGASAVFLLLGVAFYLLWKKTSNSLLREKDKRIHEKDGQIAELRETLKSERTKFEELLRSLNGNHKK